MNSKDDKFVPGRRAFLGKAATLAAAASTVGLTQVAAAGTAAVAPVPAASGAGVEPFWGTHQGGIATPQQKNLYFAAFDLLTTERAQLIGLLRSWTLASARLSQGLTAMPLTGDATQAPTDTGDVLGLPAERMTLTFGFGAGLFSKDGADRYGLAYLRPEALIDLPRFNGDQLIAERTGGDLCIQICADDEQVALHAIRQLNQLAYGVAEIRWAQTGFMPVRRGQETPRNLMGFKDGTMNVPVKDKAAMAEHVWVGDEGGWLRNGSYLVARPIRISLEHWDRMKLGFQEEVVGRHKLSGAPLGSKHEKDALNLDAVDADGNPVLPENSHTRLAAPESNKGSQILRRGYSYNNGISFTAERWPPWHQGMEFDAGLMFICYQRDPRTGFVRIFDNVAKFDMLNQFVTHIGGGLFACPPGVREGQYIGQSLFEA